MPAYRIPNGTIQQIFKGNPKCPKTVLMSFSGAIVNFADVYISPDINALKTAKAIQNNVGNPSLDQGVGVFNQGNGSFDTTFPFVIPGCTSDIYALYDQQNGHPFVDVEVEHF